MATSFQKKPSAADMADLRNTAISAASRVTAVEGEISELPAAGIIMDEAPGVIVSTTDAQSGTPAVGKLRLIPSLCPPLSITGTDDTKLASVAGRLVGISDSDRTSYEFKALVHAFRQYPYPLKLVVNGTPSIECIEGTDLLASKHLAVDGGISLDCVEADGTTGSGTFLCILLTPYAGDYNMGRTFKWHVEDTVMHTDPGIPAA